MRQWSRVLELASSLVWYTGMFTIIMIFGVATGLFVKKVPKPPNLVDRQRVASELSNLADWVGFGAHFLAAGKEGRVLVMEGGDLCAPDFLETIPGDFGKLVPKNDFESFVCWDGAKLVVVEVNK